MPDAADLGAGGPEAERRAHDRTARAVHHTSFNTRFLQALAVFLVHDGATSVLEIGAGSGRFTRFLGKLGFEAVGVERDRDACAESRGNSSRRKELPLPASMPTVSGPPLVGTVLCADVAAGRLPLSRRFDWVVALGVLEHVPEENEANFWLNLHAHNARGVVLSWARRGAHGAGHVNLRGGEEVSSFVSALGYELDEDWSAMVMTVGGKRTERIPHYERAAVYRRKRDPVGFPPLAPEIGLRENLHTLWRTWTMMSARKCTDCPFDEVHTVPPQCCEDWRSMDSLVRWSYLMTYAAQSNKAFYMPVFPSSPWVVDMPIVFWHLEKAGGRSAMQYLNAAAVTPYTEIKEYESMPEHFWGEKYFRIGLIREPCDYYASLHGQGLGRVPTHVLTQHLGTQGLHGRFFSDAGGREREQYADFVQSVIGPRGANKTARGPAAEPCGLLGMRLWLLLLRPAARELAGRRAAPCGGSRWHAHGCPAPLGDFMRGLPRGMAEECGKDIMTSRLLSKFDCWLRTERLEEDFIECMSRFSQRGGILWANWEERVRGVRHNTGQMRGACEDLYDAGLANYAERFDVPIRRRFGFPGRCCARHPSVRLPSP